MAYEYLPFSAGQHRCIGADFAIQEAKIALAMVFSQYRLEMVEGTALNLNLAMHSKHGVPMRVLPQDRQFRRVEVTGKIQQILDFGA